MTTNKHGTFIFFGATSAIAQAVAKEAIDTASVFVLVGRDAARLQVVAEDLRTRGARDARIVAGKTSTPADAEALVARAWPANETVHLALIAQGSLPDQARCRHDAAYAAEQWAINATEPLLIAESLAGRFEKQRGGCLAIIGSVAGDRGRQSNYHYGAAKAALHTFLAGLRHRFHRTGVQVLTIKPGFVDTPMTAHLGKGPLFATPERVARDIVGAVERGRPTLYTPWFWKWVMLIIRLIPDCIFNRTKL